VLPRRFPGFIVDRLSSSMDLERPFGLVYARGLLRRGQSAFAVLGLNGQETQGSIDAALTFGILWLDACHVANPGRKAEAVSAGGASALIRERMAHLNAEAAKWQRYELEERDDNLKELDIADCGNVATRLVRSTDESATHARFATAIEQVRKLICEAEIATLSSAEIAFRCHGLEFARARLAHEPGPFVSTSQIVFGVGAQERVLNDTDFAAFAQLVQSIGEVRHPEGPRDHPLWRLHPERWLESLVVRGVTTLDERLDSVCLYSQVPAFSATDRAMIDVLTITREGRLAVVELKDDGDIHLPLQVWTMGREWRGTTPAVSSSASGISLDANDTQTSRCSSWWLRLCMCIPPRTRCCITFHRDGLGVARH
jgi:hypothetical protein